MEVEEDLLDDIAMESGSQPPDKNKRPRTTPRQHEIFLRFASEFPCILDNMDKQYKNKWSELAKLLNEKPPRRTVAEWQANLKSWEYQINHRNKHPGKNKPLNDREKRALEVFGKIRDVGFSGVVLGFPQNSSPENDTSEENLPPISSTISQGNTIQELVDLNVSGNVAEAATSRKRRRVAVTNGDRMDKVIEVMVDQQKKENERQKMDEKRLKMEEDRLEIDRQNSQIMRVFADAANKMAGALEKIFSNKQ